MKFTDNYIVNGHGCHDDVMTMDELDTLLFSGSEFEVKAYRVKKQEKIMDIGVDLAVEDGE